MNIYRPFKDLTAEQVTDLGNEPSNVSFYIEDAMDDVLKAAQVMINKINALHGYAYDIATESSNEERNLVQMAESILVLASSIKTVTMADVGDWDQALEDAKRVQDFDPVKEWGTR